MTTALFIITMVAAVAFSVGTIVALSPRHRRERPSRQVPAGSGGEILARRLARGEIGWDEYAHRLHALGLTVPAPDTGMKTAAGGPRTGSAPGG
jgi:hypothetical protein